MDCFSVRAYGLYQYRYVFLLLIVYSCGRLLLHVLVVELVEISDYDTGEFYRITPTEERFTIETPGCSIPALNAFDVNIEKLMGEPKALISCAENKPALVDNNKTNIWIIKENLHYYNTLEHVNLICCYKSFYRSQKIEDIDSVLVDNRVKYRKCINFSDTVKIQKDDEFVRVSCKVEGKKVFQRYFLFAPRKKYMSHGGSKKIPNNKPAYNVVVMGIDSVSRLHFHRTMPQTLAYIEGLGAIELLGYNKIGDSTYSNVVPLLLGMKYNELKKTCLPHSESTFDSCPFVWEWFKQAGFYTAFGETFSDKGILNRPLECLFANTPTDYYIHTFVQEVTKYGSYYRFWKYLCVHGKHFFEAILDYVVNLTLALRSERLFGFFWEGSTSLDRTNYALTMDASYKSFLKRLYTSGYLSKTILFLVSDHGMRFGKIVYTQRGRLEMRLPFVFVLVPSSFIKKYSKAFKNLQRNTRRLTTPLDVHATLSDLVDLQNINNKRIRYRSKEYYSASRAISLFLPIPENRTCRMADIGNAWCTCYEYKFLSVNSTIDIIYSLTIVRNASEVLIAHLNDLLLFVPDQCAKLNVYVALSAMKLVTSYDKVAEWNEFKVVVKASPSGGIFQGVLRLSSGKTWSVLGNVSRLNPYGDQSYCMEIEELKMYCYCL